VSAVIQGAAVLWDTAPTLMQAAMAIANRILRAKLREFGGYEFDTDGAGMLAAFHNATAACQFCLEAQVWLLQAKWPQELRDHANSADESPVGEIGGALMFHGLRVGMAVHHGTVDARTTNVPDGPDHHRVQYHGPTVLQLLHLASFATGGQITISMPVWVQVKDDLVALGKPAVSDLGQHRLAFHRSGANDRLSTATSEMVGLFQVLPASLARRSFVAGISTDAMAHQGMSGGIPSQLSQFRRTVVGNESAALRHSSSALAKAVSVLDEEAVMVAESVKSVSCKLRDAQVHGRMYSQADIIAHIASLDRVVTRTDVIQRDVDRVIKSQKQQAAGMRSLEEQIAQHARVALTEDEFKRKIDLVHDRCSEKAFESKLASDHQVQQLRNALSKSEGLVGTLRGTVADEVGVPAANALSGVPSTSVSFSGKPSALRPNTAQRPGIAQRPGSAQRTSSSGRASGRLHSSIAASKKK
jgi:hypothetical protein